MIDLPDIFGALPHGAIPFSFVQHGLLRVRSVSKLPENAASVICVLFPYYLGDDYYNNINISRYAVSRDYHEICGGLLGFFAETLHEMYPENSFVPFVDSSPVPEVTAAVACGLGVQGKNTLLINEKYGSWVFIGEIVTDVHINCEIHERKFCAGCGKCAAACPSGAIGKEFNIEKCISYITQKKGTLTPEQAKLIKENGCAWGCDICQRVCPHNIGAASSPVREFYEGAACEISENFNCEGRAWAWRGEAVIKRNLALLAREEKV